MHVRRMHAWQLFSVIAQTSSHITSVVYISWHPSSSKCLADMQNDCSLKNNILYICTYTYYRINRQLHIQSGGAWHNKQLKWQTRCYQFGHAIRLYPAEVWVFSQCVSLPHASSCHIVDQLSYLWNKNNHVPSLTQLLHKYNHTHTHAYKAVHASCL